VEERYQPKIFDVSIGRPRSENQIDRMSHTSMAKSHDPRGQGAVDRGQVVGQPIDLLIVGAKWPTELS